VAHDEAGRDQFGEELLDAAVDLVTDTADDLDPNAGPTARPRR
jgi:hypothetical protein